MFLPVKFFTTGPFFCVPVMKVFYLKNKKLNHKIVVLFVVVNVDESIRCKIFNKEKDLF